MKQKCLGLSIILILATLLSSPTLADPIQNPKSKIQNQAVGGDVLLSVQQL